MTSAFRMFAHSEIDEWFDTSLGNADKTND